MLVSEQDLGARRGFPKRMCVAFPGIYIDISILLSLFISLILCLMATPLTGGRGPSDLGIDALVGQHTVLSLGRQSHILRTLGICEQRLLAVDQFEECIILWIGDARLVRYDAAHLARRGMRSHWQCACLQRSIALVRYDDTQHTRAGGQAAGTPLKK